jgi:hypothetical protein
MTYGTNAPQGFIKLEERMKIILKAIIEKKENMEDDVIFYQFYGCKTTADFYTLMGRSRLYAKDIARAIKLGIEVEILGVSGECLYPISKVLDLQGLMCNSSYTISVSGPR